MSGPRGHPGGHAGQRQMAFRTGRHGQATVISAVAACLNVALNAVLIPRFGIQGAALATLVTQCLWNGMLYLLVLRNLGIQAGVFSLLQIRPWQPATLCKTGR